MNSQLTPFFDTHVHLDNERFEDDLENVILQAKEAGIGKMISVGADMSSSENAIRIAMEHDEIYSSVGCHPHSADKFTKEKSQKLMAMCSMDKVIAVGEIGLDYFKDYTPRDIQKSTFRRMLEIAREVNLPVIVHNREAADDCLSILEDFRGEIQGVAHCFSEGPKVAADFLDLGFYISFSGTITYPKTNELAEAARMVPDDRILIETDCPYLAPQAQRGRRNEPAFVRYVAERVAQLRGMNLSDAANMTTRNGEKLFLDPVRKDLSRKGT